MEKCPICGQRTKKGYVATIFATQETIKLCNNVDCVNKLYKNLFKEKRMNA